MGDGSFDAARYMDAAAAALALPIAPEHRPGVVANLERLAAMAALVMEFPLPDETEAAPVFRP
jgi:hypothetical protein